ncbi:hypothetical protein ABBQ32_004089 [Trebouxia sp. C0010 RCD-2024]
MDSCSFWSVFFFQQDLMKARSSIQTGEIVCIMQLVKQVINSRQGVSVLNCQLVESPVVHHHPQAPVLLLHKQDGATPRLCIRDKWNYMLHPPGSGGKLDGSAKTSDSTAMMH